MMKYVKNFSEPWAVCDVSGFNFNRSDLRKQMIWAGNRLVWNGLLVGYPFYDIPNEQSRPPKMRINPEPVELPRPPMPFTSTTRESNDQIYNPETIAIPSMNYIDSNGYPQITTAEAKKQLDNVGFGGKNNLTT